MKITYLKRINHTKYGLKTKALMKLYVLSGMVILFYMTINTEITH